MEVVKKGRGLGGPAATEAEVREIEESIRGPREKGPAAAAAGTVEDRDASGAGEAGQARGGAAS